MQRVGGSDPDGDGPGRGLSAFRRNGKFITSTLGGHSVIYFDREEDGSNVYCSDCANKPEHAAFINGYTVLYDGATDVCDSCGKEIN